MLKVHQDIIISNLSVLVEKTNLNTLIPELLKKDVFNKRMINRILNPSHNEKRQKTDLYLEILKRGPQAFAKLQEALISSDHLNLANRLRIMDTQQSSQILQQNIINQSTLNSIGSNLSYSDCEGGASSQSNQRKTSDQIHRFKNLDTFPQDISPTTSGVQRRENTENDPTKISDIGDFQKNFRDPSGRVFAAPAYRLEIVDENLRKSGVLLSEDEVIYITEKNLPVQVKCSTHWQIEALGKPRIYKMDSNPRGFALLVNNKTFDDSYEYPDRVGSENDMTRMMQLLTQLHFLVEDHVNKTKREMEEIVAKFSQKPELNDVDCVWIIFMSHGEEGDNPEDGEIVGTDGIGYKTNSIISRFYSDSCRALINKPKLFFFQACRGCLTDPGVVVGKLGVNLSDRIATDGKRVRLPQQKVKVRTQSDIFVAYPTPGGYMANRDLYTGAWFIQAIVDIFSEFAFNTHLEDLLKMVDGRIKGVNNLLPSNFQAVTTKSIGWNKHLYFNPGLCKDKFTGATIRIGGQGFASQSDEGMDVVDAFSANSEKSPNGTTYSRFRDKDEESDSQGKSSCFNFSECRTS